MKRLGIILLLLLTLLLQACGHSNQGEEKAESFSNLLQDTSEVEGSEVRTINSTTLQDGIKTNQAESMGTEGKENRSTSDADTASTKIDEVVKEVVEPEKELKLEIATTTDPVKESNQKSNAKKEPSTDIANKGNNYEKDVEPTSKDTSITSKIEMDQKVTAKSDVSKQVGVTNSSGITSIGWSEFFDGEDQTTPSNRFWDLKGSTVTIKGFMGEVLSFDKHWFLLIPEPGAECPFDNGDETYWNKIMIVFVPDDVKLRYKTGPIQITGRLDAGIKIDESGYKTMFRIYDASFEEIKE